MSSNASRRGVGSIAPSRNSSKWRRRCAATQRHRRNPMLSKGQRTAILELAAQGVSQRQIARVMKISRRTVRRVIGSKSPEAPAPPRPEKAEAYRQEILGLLTKCKGNLVR